MSDIAIKFAVGMKKVFGRGAGFKIVYVVIGLNSTLVIYLLRFTDWANKSFHNKFVYKNNSSTAMLAQVNPEVAIMSWYRCENTVVFTSMPLVAFYISKIRNRIKPFVVFDWLPDFRRGINWIGHKLTFLKLIVLALLGVRSSSEVNYSSDSPLYAK